LVSHNTTWRHNSEDIDLICDIPINHSAVMIQKKNAYKAQALEEVTIQESHKDKIVLVLN